MGNPGTIQKNIELTPDRLQALGVIIKAAGIEATKGPNVGQPSYGALINGLCDLPPEQARAIGQVLGKVIRAHVEERGE